MRPGPWGLLGPWERLGASNTDALDVSEIMDQVRGCDSPHHTAISLHDSQWLSKTREKNMGMQLTGKDRAWGLALAAVLLSYFIWDFRGSGALIMLAIVPTCLLAHSFAVPSQHRPHIISVLPVGMGCTIVIGIVYLFGLYSPDIYSSREWLEDFKPIESALFFWVVMAFCVMLVGPYGHMQKNGREDKEA